MKILIPYEGSKIAETALRELRDAVTGSDDVLVVVTDVWLPETPQEISAARLARRRKLEASGICSYAPALREWEEARALRREVEKELSAISGLRSWRVEILSGCGLISNRIAERAKNWGADLIFLGAGDAENPRLDRAAGRFAQISDCPVRFARAGKPPSEIFPLHSGCGAGSASLYNG